EADVVFTGEGQTDEQTIEYGKTADYVARKAQKHNVPTILISGSLQGDMDRVRERFTGCFSTVTSVLTLEECMENAEALLYEQTTNVQHFIKSMRRKFGESLINEDEESE
ncbi:MAG TPA: glycerate kinase, partial [Pseudogracilibacillus sp.]|nr:glycerate kinase [Pseudogracilibacillus sp.]